ncbi:MAG TPA: helix-hairpin-helix domain-containing protein, partial [Steroidobacteraceae bacterium]|nr:helix-hairpin-helix domain-containing protein [Steroidobacteraceae bacterium]
PKTSWALLHREHFPVDLNTAEREQLLRVPGLGVRVVDRIVSSRKHGKLRYADLTRLGAVLRRARHFIMAADYLPAGDQSSTRLRATITAAPSSQQSLF